MEVSKSDQAVLAKIWNYTYGFADSLVLKCGVDLEIADTIHKHGEPMTLSELVSQLPNQTVDIDRLFRIMRYLVQMKLFTKEISSHSGEIKYGILPPAKFFLIRACPQSMVATIRSSISKYLIAARLHLMDGLIGGDCDPFEKAVGKKIWDYLADNPVENKEFNEAMASDSRLIASTLVNDCKHVFKGIKTLVDVGGGTGTIVKAISNAFPKIKCIVYDLPHVIADSSSIDPNPNPNPNIVCIQGDMFKFIPNADAILMKWILHDWADDECIQILKLCKEAIPQDGGKVIIVDIVLNAYSNHPYTKVRLATDLDMLVSTGGKERTEEEWKKLLEAAGFTGYKITETSVVQSVIEAFPC